MKQTVAYRNVRRFETVRWWVTLSTITTVALCLSLYFAGPKRDLAIIAVAGFILAIGAFYYAYSQCAYTVLQMQQVEELRRDSAEFVSAIKDLTAELHRRPEPRPAQMNLALFNLPKRE